MMKCKIFMILGCAVMTLGLRGANDNNGSVPFSTVVNNAVGIMNKVFEGQEPPTNFQNLRYGTAGFAEEFKKISTRAATVCEQEFHWTPEMLAALNRSFTAVINASDSNNSADGTLQQSTSDVSESAFSSLNDSENKERN